MNMHAPVIRTSALPPLDDVSAKRSFVIDGRETSMHIEDWAWDNLKRMARERGMSLRAIVTEIDRRRVGITLACALRAAVVEDLTRLAFPVPCPRLADLAPCRGRPIMAEG